MFIIYDKNDWREIVLNGKVYTRYKINPYGKVMNILTGKVLKWAYNPNGYPMVVLYYTKDECIRIAVHRLVAMMFIPNPLNKPIVHHLDHDPNNASVDNLVWVTVEEHFEYHKDEYLKGEDNPTSIYSEEQVVHVCELLEKGLRYKEIAELTGMTVSAVKNIKRGKTWAHISNKYDFSGYIAKDVPYTSEDEMYMLNELMTGIPISQLAHWLEDKFNITKKQARSIVNNFKHKMVKTGNLDKDISNKLPEKYRGYYDLVDNLILNGNYPKLITSKLRDMGIDAGTAYYIYKKRKKNLKNLMGSDAIPEYIDPEKDVKKYVDKAILLGIRPKDIVKEIMARTDRGYESARRLYKYRKSKLNI